MSYGDTTAYAKKPTMMGKPVVTPIDTSMNQPKVTKKEFVSNIKYISEAAKIKENETKLKLKEIEAAKKAKEDYLNSPLYKNRLANFYSNPESIKQGRLAALKNVNVELNQIQESKTKPETNQITYNINDPKSTFAHELGHQTGASSSIRPMSEIEKKEFLIRNIGFKTAEQRLAAMSGTYNPDTDKYNTHNLSPRENKADLDAFRGLLNDNGITQKFGQNIDLNILQKALQNKKIAEDKHIQRLLKNFSPKDVVELNNIIARQEQVANEKLA